MTQPNPTAISGSSSQLMSPWLPGWVLYFSDKEAYDNAYALLVKTKYPEAEQAFTAFLKDYPDSKLVGNANYWLGETYYVRGQYDVAAGIFSDGLTKYEASPKAADNLLKLGLTMAKLEKKKEACGFLTLLPQKYPKANQTLKQRAEHPLLLYTLFSAYLYHFEM